MMRTCHPECACVQPCHMLLFVFWAAQHFRETSWRGRGWVAIGEFGGREFSPARISLGTRWQRFSESLSEATLDLPASLFDLADIKAVLARRCFGDGEEAEVVGN